MRNFWLALAFLLGGLALLTAWFFMVWPVAEGPHGVWNSARIIIGITFLPFGLGGVFLGLFRFWLLFLAGLFSRRNGPPRRNEC